MADIDEMVWLEATSYRDWHVDQGNPDKSVVFRPQVGEETTPFSIPSKVPDQLQPVLTRILECLAELQAEADAKSFKLEVDGKLVFRGERIRAGRYALRLSPKSVLGVNECRLGPEATAMLLDEGFRNTGGLILIAGDTGAGKTTTAFATVKDRLARFGGYCLTVEAPIERDIEGFHGDEGYCEQVDATETGFKYEVASAMRKFPAETRSMFLFGEVLDEEAAAELARLIGRGHLVITTIHASNMTQAIEMLIAFAERGGETYARRLIGQNLRAVIHQRLQNQRPVVDCFRVTSAASKIIADPTANLSTLATEIDNQKRNSGPSLNRSFAQPQMRL